MARKRAMSWWNFQRIYQPTKDGPMEYEELPPKISAYHVWTLVDVEGNACHIIPGWHIVNRLGYYVTAKPWHDGDDIWVNW